jgi:F0F1-type ATP synthase membrane subunit b/b'
MQILTSLGVDHTLWIQLACFIVSYLAISNLIIKPYMAALKERELRTLGGEENAVRLIEEANQLGVAYEQKARSINNEIKSFYDRSRTEAMAEQESLVQSARNDAGGTLETAREKITSEIQSARKTLAAEVPAVSAAMASKLAGKEISL